MKTASIRYSFLWPRHIHPSGIADRCVACLAAALLETPRASWAVGCNVRAFNRRTRGTEKPTRIHYAATAAQIAHRAVDAFSHAATDKSTAAAVCYACGLYPRTSWVLPKGVKLSRNFAPVHQASITLRSRNGPSSELYLVNAGDCESFGRDCSSWQSLSVWEIRLRGPRYGF